LQTSASEGEQYLEEIIRVMPDKTKARELSEALDSDGLLDYKMIHQPLDASGNLKQTIITEFIL